MSLETMSAIHKKLNGDLPILVLPVASEDRNVSDFAAELGALIKNYPLFLKGEEVVEARPTGELFPMNPDRFCTWVEQYVRTCAIHDLKKTMSRQTAVMVLKSPAFHAHLRIVERSVCAGSPAWGKDKELRFLCAGYDAETRCYVTGPDDYRDEIKSVEEAREYLHDLYSEFKFQDESKSLAVTIGSLLTPYALLLMPKTTDYPVFVFNANDKQAWKTTAAGVTCYTAFGEFVPTDWPAGKEAKVEAQKKIFAAALVSKPYMVFDNVDGRVTSGALASILTSGEKFNGRELGASRNADVKKPLFYFTGNGMIVDRDLLDRFLFVELFRKEPPGVRCFKRSLTYADILARRRAILACCWRLVAAWVDAGRPASPEAGDRFNDWRRCVGGIVHFNGFGDPFEQVKLPHADPTEDEDLVAGIAAMQLGTPYLIDALLDLWQPLGLFESRLRDRAAGDTRAARSVSSWAGKLMARAVARVWGGRMLTRSPGRAKTYTATIEEGCMVYGDSDIIPL